MKDSSLRTSAMAAQAGLPPGSAVFVGSRKMDTSSIDIISYNEEIVAEEKDCPLERALEPAEDGSVTWINITGIHDTELIDAIGRRFGLHPLTREDIVNTGQRPKAEEFPEYIYLVLKMMTYSETSRDIDVEHVSLVLGGGVRALLSGKARRCLRPCQGKDQDSLGKDKGQGGGLSGIRPDGLCCG